MRRHLCWAIGIAATIGVTSVASAANTQELSVKFSPAKAPKRSYAGGSLDTTTTTGLAGGTLIAPPTNSKVYFDDDIKFDSKGLATCSAAKLQSTITSVAKQLCRSSIVGSGKAVTAIGGIPTSQVESVVTAFNGKRKNGKPTLILHNRSDSIATTVVLTGVLKDASGDYGKYLEVPVPPLPLDSSVISFQLKTGRTYRAGGSKHNFVAARCADANHKWNFKSRFFYKGNPPLTSFATQNCTVRK